MVAVTNLKLLNVINTTELKLLNVINKTIPFVEQAIAGSDTLKLFVRDNKSHLNDVRGVLNYFDNISTVIELEKEVTSLIKRDVERISAKAKAQNKNISGKIRKGVEELLDNVERIIESEDFDANTMQSKLYLVCVMSAMISEVAFNMECPVEGFYSIDPNYKFK